MSIPLLSQSLVVSVGAPTLQTIRARVSRKVETRKPLYVGTATSGSVSALTDPLLTHDDGHWKGADLRALTGANAGLARRVFNNGVESLVFDPFPAAFANGDQYELRAQHPSNAVDDAIREAIQDATGLVWIEISDSSLVWVSGQQTYTIPASFTFLYAVEYVDSQGQSHVIRHDHWRVEGGLLRLDEKAIALFAAPTITSPGTNIITLRGYRAPALPQAETDPVEVNPSFVVWFAAGALRGEGFSGPSMDADGDAQAFSTFMQFDASRGPMARTYLKPNSRRVR